MQKRLKSRSLFIALIALVGSLFLGNSSYLFAKAELAQYLLNQAWDSSQESGIAVPPWPWADTKPLVKLNFGSQHLSYIVMTGSSGRTLAFAPGHLSGTALPGNVGHSIVSAHRDTHFKILQHLVTGDIISTESLNKQITLYKVTDITIVDIRTQPLILTPEKNRLTLITCYPFDALTAGSYFRYQVDAIRI